MSVLKIPSEPQKELWITADGEVYWVVGKDYSRGWNGSQWIPLKQTASAGPSVPPPMPSAGPSMPPPMPSAGPSDAPNIEPPAMW